MEKPIFQTIPSRTIPIVQEVWIESDPNFQVQPQVETGPPEKIKDFKYFCRVCALERDHLISIFGPKGKKLRLASKINKNLPITVNACDKLPTQICQDCISRLDATIELLDDCVKAQLQLAEILVNSEKQINSSKTPESYSNESDDSMMSDRDESGSEGVFNFPKEGDQKRVREETAIVTDPLMETTAENGALELESDEKRQKKSLESDISGTKSEISVGQVIKSTNSEAPKKPKFNVVVVKVKNNGKMPDHKQIAQTLRELKLDLKNTGQKRNSLEAPAKEGHVVILNESLNISGQNLNIDELKNNPSFEIKIDSGGNKEVSIKPSKSNAASRKDEKVVPEDHSYTHWNQKHEKCEYCSETFIGRVNLIAHQMKEHKSNVFCCFRCDQVFYDSKADYDKHVQAHCISSIKHARKAQQRDMDKEVAAGPENNASSAELKVTAVARVSVDEEDGLSDELVEGSKNEKVREVKTYKSSLRMKLSKEFEGMDPNLKNKIVGTIQRLVNQNKFSNSLRSLYCTPCNLAFTSATAFETHRWIKHDERLPCRFCSRLCRSEVALKKHEDHYHFKDFKCDICEERFKSRSLLRKHELSHFGERPYKCNLCGKSYTSRGSLQIHQTTHSNEKPYLCDKCGKGFKHVSNLNAHRRTHSDDPSVVKAHRCPICTKAFRCQFLVREHMRVHTGDKPFVCEHCGKSFYKKQQLRQHSAVHSAIPPFKCNVCGARFNRKGNMMQHQKRHGKEGVFTCKICGETFPSVGLVLRHRRSHGEEAILAENGERVGSEGIAVDPELTLACKCDLCGKFLSSKVSLTLHMRTHTGERPYTCPVCNKSFSQSTSLKVHKRTHTGERPFVCGVCSRAFSSRAALTVHERGHTGERPYPCKDCGKSFRCAAALKQHASTHSDDRPYPCEYCMKKFRRKEALEIHLRTHTGERPYGCRICGRRFAQKGDARKHERTHEKVSGRRQSNCSSVSPNVAGVLLDECSNNSFENQPLSLVEITTDPESVSVTDQADPTMHPSLQLEHSVVEHSYPNLPPGTIIINAQDLMTSSSEITVVAEEDLNNHLLGNSISIHYDEG